VLSCAKAWHGGSATVVLITRSLPSFVSCASEGLIVFPLSGCPSATRTRLGEVSSRLVQWYSGQGALNPQPDPQDTGSLKPLCCAQGSGEQVPGGVHGGLGSHGCGQATRSGGRGEGRGGYSGMPLHCTCTLPLSCDCLVPTRAALSKPRAACSGLKSRIVLTY